MKLNQYRANGCIVIAFITVFTAVCMLSTTVFATSGNRGGTTSQSRANHTFSNTAADGESEILSSEDWNALLNTSSEENSQAVAATEETTALNSPLANGIGKHSIFIWGCIAVGLGILGIAFFIYSQFIYKHIKKPTEPHHVPLHDSDNTKEATFRRGDSFKAQITQTESGIEQLEKVEANPEQAQSKETAAKEQKTESPLKAKDKTETEAVDWDQFFEDYKNQQQKNE